MLAQFWNFQRTTVHHKKKFFTMSRSFVLPYSLSENGVFSVTAQVPCHSCFSKKKLECPEHRAVFRYVHILPNFHFTISLPNPHTMPCVIQPGGGVGKMCVRYHTQEAWPCCCLKVYAGRGYYIACLHVRTACNPPPPPPPPPRRKICPKSPQKV